MQDLLEQLEDLVEQALVEVGLALWGLEFVPSKHSALLRVYIHKHTGEISLEDCERASKQISAHLDVEDPITSHFTLEVSSPGVERKLFKLEQYQDYCGYHIKVQSLEKIDERKNFSGQLESVDLPSQSFVLRDTSIGKVTISQARVKKAVVDILSYEEA